MHILGRNNNNRVKYLQHLKSLCKIQTTVGLKHKPCLFLLAVFLSPSPSFLLLCPVSSHLYFVLSNLSLLNMSLQGARVYNKKRKKEGKKTLQSKALCLPQHSEGIDLYGRVGVDFYSKRKSLFKPPLTPFHIPAYMWKKMYHIWLQ